MTNPLLDPPPAQLPLLRAPLIRVIVALRFPLVAEIESTDFASTFQRAVGESYPIAEKETTQTPTALPGGAFAIDPKVVWRFRDDAGWRVSLARDFLALETERYESRSDLLARLAFVVDAFTKQTTPARIDRLGVRYVDRIQGADLDDIATLVRPELAGIAKTPLASQCVHSLSDHLFDVGGAQLAARWGLLPSHATPDPSAIEPTNEPSWILDLDLATEQRFAFRKEDITARTEAFAARIYAFFRWAVTDEFLSRFGGDS